MKYVDERVYHSRGAGHAPGRHSPAQRDLDGRGEAGGEEVGGQVGDHGQQLAGLAGRQLDAVLHGGRQRHLRQRVVRVDRGHLRRAGQLLAWGLGHGHPHVTSTTTESFKVQQNLQKRRTLAAPAIALPHV